MNRVCGCGQCQRSPRVYRPRADRTRAADRNGCVPAGLPKTLHLRGEAAVAMVAAMFKGNKQYLPSKPCAACGRTMTWRKAWARNWDSVRYCSERCRRARPAPG